MKKLIFTLIILIILGLILFAFYNNNNNSTPNTQSNPNTARTATDVNTEHAENRLAALDENHTGGNFVKPAHSETEIATYSTAIRDNSSGRLVNIRLTCSVLNGTIVNPGETFSFNNVVGKPTVERGYQEATVIINHESEKGIGGGNCQVSSTLYNAILAVPQLQVTERHEHGKDVTYVPEGKDAAVSYGSLDLKFKNNTGKQIRIDITTDDKNITAKLMQISE